MCWILAGIDFSHMAIVVHYHTHSVRSMRNKRKSKVSWSHLAVHRSMEAHIIPPSSAWFSPAPILTVTTTERVQIIRRCLCSLTGSVWPAATTALWERWPGSALCSCATAPDSPVPRERFYFQTCWRTCCSCWWSTAGLPLRRRRCPVCNALQNNVIAVRFIIRCLLIKM